MPPPRAKQLPNFSGIQEMFVNLSNPKDKKNIAKAQCCQENRRSGCIRISDHRSLREGRYVLGNQDASSFV